MNLLLSRIAACDAQHTSALTDEAIDAPLNALADALQDAGIPPERFRTLRPGQVWQL